MKDTKYLQMAINIKNQNPNDETEKTVHNISFFVIQQTSDNPWNKERLVGTKCLFVKNEFELLTKMVEVLYMIGQQYADKT